MPAVIDSILSDILRLGNAPITEKTVPALKVLNGKVLDFADSLMAKGSSVDELSDFEEALDGGTSLMVKNCTLSHFWLRFSQENA